MLRLKFLRKVHRVQIRDRNSRKSDVGCGCRNWAGGGYIWVM